MKNIRIIVGFFCAIGLGWGLRSFSKADVEEVAEIGAEIDVQKEAKPDVEGSDQDSDESTTPKRTKTVIVEASEAEEDAEYAAEEAEALKELVDRMVTSFKNKVKLRMDLFLPELHLSDSQLASLEKFIEEQSSLYDDASTKVLNEEEPSESDLELMSDLGGLKNFAGVFEDILTPEQQKIYEELERKDRENRVESEALGKLAKLQSGLNLSAEQKDAVYHMLYEEAEAGVDQPSVVEAMFAGIAGEGTLEAFGGLGDFLNFTEEEGLDVLFDEEANMDELAEDFLDSRTQRFSEILSEEQQTRYRANLKQQLALVLEVL